ncbi:MAG TPA: hypothetical protein DIW23_01985 [Anaerolineae bacterium]|nr:hypothetical protein [Anaerolineae bacterium]
MRTLISATGYVNVIMVLNMKRFIKGDEKEQSRFESFRGTPEFSSVIKSIWGKEKVSPKGIFEISSDVNGFSNNTDQMTTEQVGFSTGIFRNLILEEHTFPTYKVNKSYIKFPEYLLTNYQFSKLFIDVWDNWDIYIRPVYTGLFVLRLMKKYEKPETLLNISQTVNRLQESFDIPSALKWQKKILENQKFSEVERDGKVQSIQELLEWLCGDEEDFTKHLYIPVQAKIGMEVASLFVEEIAGDIEISNQKSISLIRPQPRSSIPLHDSYVIYHIDKLYTNKKIKSKLLNPENKKNVPNNAKDTLEEISVQSIQDIYVAQQQICNLIEGAVLRPSEQEASDKNKKSTKLEGFPALRKQFVNEIFEKNMSSWDDELCLMMSRVAVFIPSKKYRDYQLVVSTLSRSTSHIKYVRYWGAIERMVELILSIRVLAQLLERMSYSLLGRTATEMHKIRGEMLDRDIKMNTKNLSQLISEAADLQRLVSLCQGLSDPHVWSRAEYGIVKAKHLINELGILVSLEHIQRNIDAINQFGDHLDELYLADLTENNNKLSLFSSTLLAGISFILTILILPSFWADIKDIKGFHSKYLEFLLTWLKEMELIGSILATIMIFLAFLMMIVSIPQLYKILKKEFLDKNKKNISTS